MLSLLQAGFVAAVRQLGAVGIVTLSILLLESHDLIFQVASARGSDAESLWISISPRLIWAYLLIAAGLALSRGRSIDVTAAHMRRASLFVRFGTPQSALKALVGQLGLSAIMLALFDCKHLNPSLMLAGILAVNPWRRLPGPAQ